MARPRTAATSTVDVQNHPIDRGRSLADAPSSEEADYEFGQSFVGIRGLLITVVVFASGLLGVALACGIFGVPVSVVDEIAVRLADGPLPPGPGPGPNPSPFDDLADQIAAEARNVDSRNRSRECTAMASAIEQYLDRQSAPTLEQLFADLRRSITPAIPPRSADAWRPFNLRVDELLADEFDAGRLNTVADGVSALRAIAAGLRDAAERF